MYERNVARILALADVHDKWRKSCLNLIASEPGYSDLVLKELGGRDLCKRYAERDKEGNYYYHGTKYIKLIENEVDKALKLLFPYKHIEFRPISGTIANDIVFSAYLRPGDKVIVNNTPAGGHISHYYKGAMGKYTKEIIDFRLTDDKYHIDVDKTKEVIEEEKPRLIVLGKSLFLFPEPVKELADVCKENGTLIVYDASHVLGLIASGKFQDPLKEGADIIVASTHKTFPGPQRGIILSDLVEEEWKKIEERTFPGSVSNHHLSTLPALGITTYEMLDFGKAYAEQIIRNSKTLAKELDKYGFDVQAKEFGYTESHQVAVDMTKFGGGKKGADSLERNNVVLNMNLLPDEDLSNHKNPKGIRIGVQEETRAGMMEGDIGYWAYLIMECFINNKDVTKEVLKLKRRFSDSRYGHNPDFIEVLRKQIKREILT